MQDAAEKTDLYLLQQALEQAQKQQDLIDEKIALEEDEHSQLLEQFLRGVIGGPDVWRRIERHQRHRDVGAWPDFGSGGLGSRRGRRNSPSHRQVVVFLLNYQLKAVADAQMVSN